MVTPCCHIWAGASARFLLLLDRVHKRIVNLLEISSGSTPKIIERRTAQEATEAVSIVGTCGAI